MDGHPSNPPADENLPPLHHTHIHTYTHTQDVAASIMTISVSEGLILQLDPDFDMVRSGA
jgi:hypothetical protein